MTILLYKYLNEQKFLVTTALMAVLAGIIGFFLVLNPFLAVAAGTLPFALWFGMADKKNALFLFLLLLPYHALPLLTENFMGITGAKPFNLLSAFMVIMFFFHRGKVLNSEDAIEKKTMWFFYIYLLLFAATVIRSLDYLPLLNALSPEDFHNSPLNHILSFFIRPTLFALSFIYILKHIKTEKEIHQCINVICISVFILSCVILSIAFVNFHLIITGREYISEAISSFFNLHRNAIGTVYIICTPLLVLGSLRKSLFAHLNFASASVTVFLLQSRSTILLFLFSILLFLYFLKNWRTLVFFCSVFFVFFLFLLPGFIERVILIGFETGNLNEIFTGRIERIWIPLIKERLSNLGTLLFGTGLYSILTSPAYLQGEIYQTNHPHNAFLEILIDCGLILFTVFIVFLSFSLKKACSLAGKINTPTGWALLTCLLTYLVATMSGRNFYPSRNTMFLFPVLALSINYFRISFYHKINHL